MRHELSPVTELTTRELVEELVAGVREAAREELSAARLRFEDDLALARRELSEEARRAKGAAEATWIGGVIANAAIIFLLGAVTLGLDAAGLPLWASALLVGALAGAGGGLLASSGWRRLRRLNFTPHRTIRSVKEDLRWMTERFRALTTRLRPKSA